MTITPFALSLLGVEPVNQRRQPGQEEGDAVIPDEVQQVPELRPVRNSRRATSYYNSFQTVCSTSNDDPPSYETAARQRQPRRPAGYGKEVLPSYSCSVATGAKVLLQLESISPLHGPSESDWREVYVILRGTLLNIYRAKGDGAGKLLRSYTLQHAEVGIAPDTEHTVLVPQTRLAALLPSAARRKAWQKDPDLFRAERQYIIRLRAETDQILLAHSSETQIGSMINLISAGIDISNAIDERSIPRQCTIPRRRRRQRAEHTGDLNDPALVEEQERLLRNMYPAFAERTLDAHHEPERTATNTTGNEPTQLVRTPTREEDELDLAIIREDSAAPADRTPMQLDHSRSRPPMDRHTTSSSVHSAYSAEMMYATSPTNFSPSGKWEPQTTRTAQQVQRYIRRCTPVLMADAIRASDILICNGRRVKINWRMELMEEWELQPPSYNSHHFERELGLERTRSCSQNSATGSAEQDQPQTPSSLLAAEADDQITTAESALAHLEISKIAAVSVADKGLRCETAPKPRRSSHTGSEIHGGVVFCF
ncbi:hypothetical protein LTR37_004383 [Vermiconidia calcicola]|uniref:Uncharacterized protein n=1 Tax=Vermiconidia calcicola TaxID=1690605 RepID=A0ACC3NN29_9PEZI|nr:hypothetical protein LTR37_004383 [Vermiconidia calcicola]